MKQSFELIKGVSDIDAKFNMTQEQNIFVAKRNIVDYIYNSAKLEGCNVTFPQTQTILDGVNVGSVKLDDIQTILNLRDAWKFVLSTMNNFFDIDYICKVNEHISRNESLEWGVLRKGSVGISGTEYIPPIPNRENVIKELSEILSIKNVTEKAIKFFLWACRSQLFWDGNKRTATVCANKILIAEGAGVFTVKEKYVEEFNEKLVAFYNTGDYFLIDNWLYDNCIDGIDFPKE